MFHNYYFICYFLSLGICDYTTGICACATGYEDNACSTQGSIIVNPCATPDLSVHASCASFTGSALHVKSTKAKATDFDLILATASTTNLFAVRGDGRLRVYEGGLIVTAGGQTVVAGGLIVTAGGATVTAGGLAVLDGGGSISSTATGTPVLTVHASETGSAYASDVLHVKSTRASATAFNLMKASVGTTTDVFAIRGDGRVNVIQGGLLVTAGGTTVTSGGVHVSDGMTIHTSGLRVVAGGTTIVAGGLKVVDGGSTILNTATGSSALTVHASDATSSFTNAALTLKTTRASNAAFKLVDMIVDAAGSSPSMFSVDGTGKATAAAGFVSTAGGGTISAGGLQVYAGTTIHTGGLNIVNTGATITAGGLNVVDGGGTIKHSSASADVLTVRATSGTMAQSVLHLKADRSSSLSSLNMIKTSSDAAGSAVTKFTVNGDGDLATTSATVSTTATSGSIKTAGGMGIAKQAYIGGVLAVLSTTDSISPTTGSVVVAGGMGIAKDLYVGGVLIVSEGTSVQPHTVTGDTEIKTHSNTPATTTSLTLKRSRGSTGSPTAVHSGDTLAEMVWQGWDGDSYESASQIRTVVENAGAPVSDGQMGGKLIVATSASGTNTLTDRMSIDMAGQVKVLSTVDSTSISSGSLATLGGIGVAGAIYSGGMLSAIIDNSANSAVTDALVLSHTTSGTAAAGIGVGASIHIENAAGTVAERAALDFSLTDVTNGAEVGKMELKLANGAGAVPVVLTVTGTQTTVAGGAIAISATTGSVKSAGGMGIAKQLYVGLIGVVLGTTDADSATTGAVVTAGGVGVAKRVYAGIAIVSSGATDATSATTGSLVSAGGLGVAKRIYSGGGMGVMANTPATSSTTGSLVAVGGAGVALNIYAGAAIVAEGTTASISATTGSLLTKGGLGVAGRAYVLHFPIFLIESLNNFLHLFLFLFFDSSP